MDTEFRLTVNGAERHVTCERTRRCSTCSGAGATAFTILESIRLDLGYRVDVRL